MELILGLFILGIITGLIVVGARAIAYSRSPQHQIDVRLDRYSRR